MGGILKSLCKNTSTVLCVFWKLKLPSLHLWQSGGLVLRRKRCLSDPQALSLSLQTCLLSLWGSYDPVLLILHRSQKYLIFFSLQCLTFYRHFFWEDLLLVTQHFKGKRVWGSRLPGRVCFLLCSLCHEPFVLLFAALDKRHTVSEWLYNPYSHWYFWSCLRLWTDGGNTGYK